MSHIDNITRATKASNILAQATNVHLDLHEQINRLAATKTWSPLFAAYKALTGEAFSVCGNGPIMTAKLTKQFILALDITGNSLEEKLGQINEFGKSVQDQS